MVHAQTAASYKIPALNITTQLFNPKSTTVTQVHLIDSHTMSAQSFLNAHAFL